MHQIYKILFRIIFLLFFYLPFLIKGQENNIPPEVKRLLEIYPQSIVSFVGNQLVFKDGSTMMYDDGIRNKSFQQLLDDPDIEDQFHFKYTVGKTPFPLEKDFDPGRIRNELFFKKLYGNSKEEVADQLIEINWCPRLIGKKIKVTTSHGVSKAFQQLSNELDNHEEFKPFLQEIGGSFVWRKISGTNRLSMHSFGMTIDINVSQSHYWQWDCKCKNEDVNLEYRNNIPLSLVEIFEKHGFIWGGKWYHYDTMHFEFRPELLPKR